MVVNYDGENLASSSSEYRMPLVWIDLEMTGKSLIPPITFHMMAGAHAATCCAGLVATPQILVETVEIHPPP